MVPEFQSLEGFKKPLLPAGQSIQVVVYRELGLLHQIKQIWAQYKVGEQAIDQCMKPNGGLPCIGAGG